MALLPAARVDAGGARRGPGGDRRPEPTGAEPRQVAKSLAYELEFPTQQHKLGPGDVVDPETERGEEIVEIDEGTGRLWIKRGRKRSEEPLPRAPDPRRGVGHATQRAALMRLGEEIRDGGGKYRALRAILRRSCRPRWWREARRELPLHPGPAGRQDVDGRAARPPAARAGSGRDRGADHKAIHNLCASSSSRASRRRLKKCSAGDKDTHYDASELIENESELEPFLDPELKLLAGTAWLFSRAELDSTLDYLFVDEAGQVSLADALAMGTAATNLVLLGDPLQLAQVSQGVHPGGTGCSVLEHLLGEHATIPPERGLFLEHTRRMHLEVCAFVSEVVYDGRLESAEGLERQELEGVGAGIRHRRSSTRAGRSRRRRRRSGSPPSSRRCAGAGTRRRTGDGSCGTRT